MWITAVRGIKFAAKVRRKKHICKGLCNILEDNCDDIYNNDENMNHEQAPIMTIK